MEEQVNYTEIIKQEYLKCAKDPVYFMKNYCFIQHPLKGKIKFDLYPFQESALTDLNEHRFNIILKSRQMGISTLMAGIILHRMIFLEDQNILVIATKANTAKNLITKVKTMYKEMPSWLQPKTVEDNKMSIAFKNGSIAKAVGSSPDAGRSEALSLLVIDEAAFIRGIDEIWSAARSTLSTGGDCVLLSTPNGEGNLFHTLWKGAIEQENSFNPIFLPWQYHPERSQEWRDEQTGDLGDKKARQECDGSFLASGETVLDLDRLKEYEEETIIDPIDKRYDNKLWLWKLPNPEYSYLISADVARGDGSDYSAFHIIDVDTLEQVGEYRGKISTNEYAKILYAIATEYNNALLAVENASMGWAVLDHLINMEYRNLYYTNRAMATRNIKKMLDSELKGGTKDLVPGFTTSGGSRPLIVEKMEERIRKKEIILHSIRLLNELKSFIYINGKPEARPGQNDDLVMSLCIGIWIREYAIKLRIQGKQISEALLRNVSKIGGYEINETMEIKEDKEKNKIMQENNIKSSIYSSKANNENPFIYNTDYGDIDLSKWL